MCFFAIIVCVNIFPLKCIWYLNSYIVCFLTMYMYHYVNFLHMGERNIGASHPVLQSLTLSNLGFFFSLFSLFLRHTELTGNISTPTLQRATRSGTTPLRHCPRMSWGERNWPWTRKRAGPCSTGRRRRMTARWRIRAEVAGRQLWCMEILLMYS